MRRQWQVLRLSLTIFKCDSDKFVENCQIFSGNNHGIIYVATILFVKQNAYRSDKLSLTNRKMPVVINLSLSVLWNRPQKPKKKVLHPTSRSKQQPKEKWISPNQMRSIMGQFQQMIPCLYPFPNRVLQPQVYPMYQPPQMSMQY